MDPERSFKGRESSKHYEQIDMYCTSDLMISAIFFALWLLAFGRFGVLIFKRFH